MIAERTRDKKAVVNRTIHDRASLAQTWEAPKKRRTMAFRGPLILRGAQELRFRSPEALVALIASFCVSMFCFYVAAYARVTSDGIKAVDLEHRASAAEEETERLRAELSLVSGPANVEKRAKEMKMIPGANAAKISNAPFDPEYHGSGVGIRASGVGNATQTPNPESRRPNPSPEATP